MLFRSWDPSTGRKELHTSTQLPGLTYSIIRTGHISGGPHIFFKNLLNILYFNHVYKKPPTTDHHHISFFSSTNFLHQSRRGHLNLQKLAADRKSVFCSVFVSNLCKAPAMGWSLGYTQAVKEWHLYFVWHDKKTRRPSLPCFCLLFLLVFLVQGAME